MKNKIIFSFIICLLLQSLTYLQANDEFNFNMTEIEITNEGNFFKGLKRGTVKTNNEQTIIAADTFEYDKNKNILNAKGNVEIIDKIKNYVIQSSDIVYFKNTEEIISKGVTEVLIETKYKILSSDISINRISNTLRSIKKTIIIDDNFNRYEIDTIDYSIDKSILKAKNINITTNINSINNDEKEFYFFKDGIFNLEKKIL